MPANLAIAVHPKELYVLQEFRRDGVSETLVLADKLVPQFCAATKFEPTGEPMQSFPGSKLEGIGAQHPFLPRTAIVLTADFVTMDTGTGAVHIAPGHGEDDYSLGKMNGLPILSPVDDQGRYTAEAGLPELIGKYVFDANADIVRLLRERGMLIAEQPYQHSYPYCWRSKTPIIFRAVEQFFIRIDDLRARRSMPSPRSPGSRPGARIASPARWNRGPIGSSPASAVGACPCRSFIPPRAKHCSTRNGSANSPTSSRKRGSNVWFELDDAALAQALGLPEGTRHRNDTIDVWIDSGVSHQAVCATHPELRDPADMYLEATDQHRGWFQSSLMTSVALHDRAPYKTCVTHGFVVDVDGKKISKSSTYNKPMDAGHFVGRHGADLVRLWVSSVNYTDDVPFSEEMFTRLGDTYRRIRNTLRILLGNLHDFESGSQESMKEGLTLVDRWILDRLQEVIEDCRAAYAAYEFHKVYHTLNQFCAVDLSSLYVDITKDRMYCDAVDSRGDGRRRRRCARSSRRSAGCSLRSLSSPPRKRGVISAATTRFTCNCFPSRRPICATQSCAEQIEELLKLRGVIGQAIEKARQEKLIGNALEAAVVLHCDERFATSLPREELEEFFILSDLKLEPAKEPSASITLTPHKKCARCWRHRPTVGTIALHPELCDRCAAVVEARA